MKVIVVGGGSGGAAFAGTLAANGRHDVTLLEAGPDYGPYESGRWPAELLQTASLAGTHDWGLENEDVEGGRRYTLGRAKVIGGCSSHNGCSAVRGLRSDFEGWCAATGSDFWRADAVLPDFQAIETKLRLRDYPNREIPPFQARALQAALATLGLPPTREFNDLDEGPAAGFCPVNKHGSTRWNAAFAFLDPVRDSGHLTILGEAEATQLLLDGTRCSGVRFERDGKAQELTADLVVVAGGAYGSPMLLLRSGIGDPAALERAGIPLRHALPGVGRNLQDHPSAALYFAGSAGLQQAMEAFEKGQVAYEEGVIVKARSSHATTAVDLHLVPCGGRLPDGSFYWMILVALVTARGRGLIEPQPGGRFAIRHRHFNDAGGRDLAAVIEGIGMARRMAAGFEGLGAELQPGPATDLAGWLADNHVHYWHPASTCAMGIGAEAVTDAHGQVRGLDGLMVADTSIMPTVVAANTNLAAVMIGYRLANWVAAR